MKLVAANRVDVSELGDFAIRSEDECFPKFTQHEDHHGSPNAAIAIEFQLCGHKKVSACIFAGTQRGCNLAVKAPWSCSHAILRMIKFAGEDGAGV